MAGCYGKDTPPNIKKMDEIVTVEILDENLKTHYGTYKRYSLAKAMRGQTQGLWRIVSEKDKYEDKEIRPGSYLKKTKFRKGLTFRDMYGEKKRK